MRYRQVVTGGSPQAPAVTSASKRNAPMTKELPSPELLRKLLRYEPETGKLFWRKRSDCEKTIKMPVATWNKMFSGREAFTAMDAWGYKVGKIYGIQYKSHRVVFAICNLRWPISEIDHINGNRSDNRIENLREVTRQQNQRNVRLKSTNTTGHCGVGWDKSSGKWRASIGHFETFRYLGSFATKADAISARKKAEIEMGYHPNHGRTTCPTAKGKTQ